MPRYRPWRAGLLPMLCGLALLATEAAHAQRIDVIEEIQVAARDRSPAEARARAFSQALHEAVARAWERLAPGRPLPSPAKSLTESAVAFVDVIEETVAPGFFSARYSVGVDLDRLAAWAGVPKGAAPVPMASPGPAFRSTQTAATVGIDGVPIRLGEPGALEAYRRHLAERGAHWMTLRHGEDGALDLSVRNPGAAQTPGATSFE